MCGKVRDQQQSCKKWHLSTFIFAPFGWWWGHNISNFAQALKEMSHGLKSFSGCNNIEKCNKCEREREKMFVCLVHSQRRNKCNTLARLPLFLYKRYYCCWLSYMFLSTVQILYIMLLWDMVFNWDNNWTIEL